jgi:hypothetical protein
LFVLGSCKEADRKLTPYEDDSREKTDQASNTLDWAKAWVSAVRRHQRCFTYGLPLPMPQSELRFASLVDVLPLPQMATPLYRYGKTLVANFIDNPSTRINRNILLLLI